MSATTGKISKATWAALGLGAVGLVAFGSGVTWMLDHGLHAHGARSAEGADHGGEPKGEHGEHGGEEHEEGKVRLSSAARANAELEVLTAGPGTVAVTVELPGELALNAEALAHVTPRVSGTVREVKKQLGDVVKKGEVLAVLESRDLAELQRDVAATKERLALAELEFERQEKLWQEKISAEKDYLAAKKALAEARIEHRSAAQKLAAAGGVGPAAKGSGYSLLAPLDGTIIEKHAAVGEVLKDDTQAFVVADLSTVWANVTVYAKDLARIRVGQAVSVRAEGVADRAQGSIAYLGHVVGEETRSATARVVLPNPGAAWRPGLFVTVEVTVDRAEVPVFVAADAVQTLEGKAVVFVEEGDAFEARPVKLGRRGLGPGGREAVEIREGLAAGIRYVGDKSFVLKAELGKAEAGHEH